MTDITNLAKSASQGEIPQMVETLRVMAEEIDSYGGVRASNPDRVAAIIQVILKYRASLLSQSPTPKAVQIMALRVVESTNLAPEFRAVIEQEFWSLLSQERPQVEEKKDFSAGLIHQTIPDVEGTEPRPNTGIPLMPNWRENAAVAARARYCPMCDDYTKASECKACGMPTEKVPNG